VLRIAKALSSQWLATIYVAGISALLSFYLARALGPTAFGNYSYILAIASLIATTQDFGFRSLLVREKTAATPNLNVSAASILRQALGNNAIVTFIALTCVALVPTSNKFALWTSIGCFSLVVACQTISAGFRGEGKFSADARWQVAARTLSALAIFVVLIVFDSHIAPMTIFLAWTLGLLSAILLFARSRITRPQLPQYGQLGPILLSLAIVDLATSVYFKIDIIMLGHLSADAAEVGYYSAAYKFLEGSVLLLAPVGHVAFRALRARWMDSNAFAKVLRLNMLFMFGLGVAAALVAMGVSDWLVTFVYGAGYARSSVLLVWIMVALVFLMPNYILTQAALAKNRTRYYAAVTVVVAVTNVLLNLWLIPLYQGVGAAWATVASELLMFILLVFGFRQELMSVTRPGSPHA